MAAMLLLLHWLISSTAYAVPLLMPAQQLRTPIRPLPPQGTREAVPLVASGGFLLSFLLCSCPDVSNRASEAPWPPNLERSSGGPHTHQWLDTSTRLFACRPRPKKEKAQRNYRIAKQQKRIREERLIRRRQQQDIFKAHQRLLLACKRSEESNSSEDKCQKRPLTGDLFSLDGPLLAGEQATTQGNASPGLQPPLTARINYRLVGGTWRRARGQGKYVRLSGAQLAAAVFEGLPEEEVAAAVAKAKRQDEGFMDLEAYDESGTEHTTLEGLN